VNQEGFLCYREFDTLRGRFDLYYPFPRVSPAAIERFDPRRGQEIGFHNGWNIDPERIELLSSPRCNLGKNVNDEEDDNPGGVERFLYQLSKIIPTPMPR